MLLKEENVTVVVVARGNRILRGKKVNLKALGNLLSVNFEDKSSVSFEGKAFKKWLTSLQNPRKFIFLDNVKADVRWNPNNVFPYTDVGFGVVYDKHMEVFKPRRLD
ncbi:hypothetical protein ACFLZN_02240, partial [Nanoarchaeota archaeon]